MTTKTRTRPRKKIVAVRKAPTRAPKTVAKAYNTTQCDQDFQTHVDGVLFGLADSGVGGGCVDTYRAILVVAEVMRRIQNYDPSIVAPEAYVLRLIADAERARSHSAGRDIANEAAQLTKENMSVPSIQMDKPITPEQEESIYDTLKASGRPLSQLN